MSIESNIWKESCHEPDHTIINVQKILRSFTDREIPEDIIQVILKASVVSFDAHLNHSYVGNIINFKKNNPSRDALICIAFALSASEEELQYLLKYAGHAPLYVRRKRDVIIWFGIMKGESLETVNDNLLARELKPLFKE